ncbi:MAG: hypothetical protein EOP46_08170 [Sphingobacteriaceae bacterium]|nr:MAG: hypothetical protein EOP46_08170 [Sphingobacteriaceae bacterium]
MSQMQMNHMNMMSMMSLYSRNSNSNPKYTFTVKLKDSTVKEVKSIIYADTSLHKSYLLLVDKSFKKSDPKRETKIYVDQTLSISRETPSREIVTGSPTDSCWLFKVVEGPVKAYSFLAGNTSFYDQYSIVGIQKGNDPIEPFKPENLKKMIAADPKATEQFNKKHYLKALKTYNKNAAKKTLN